jgi:thioredoxin-like negative regulator of GroEL
VNESIIKTILQEDNGINPKVFKINVDREPNLTRMLDIKNLPELIVIRPDGQRQHVIGEITKESMLNHLQ